MAWEKRQGVTGSFAAGCGWIIPAILSRLKLHFFQRIGSTLHLFCQILHSNHLCEEEKKKVGVSSHQLQAAETGIPDWMTVGECRQSFVWKLVLGLHCKASFKYIRQDSARTMCPLPYKEDNKKEWFCTQELLSLFDLTRNVFGEFPHHTDTSNWVREEARDTSNTDAGSALEKLQHVFNFLLEAWLKLHKTILGKNISIYQKGNGEMTACHARCFGFCFIALLHHPRRTRQRGISTKHWSCFHQCPHTFWK